MSFSKQLGVVSLVALFGGAALAEEAAKPPARPAVAKPAADSVRNVWKFFNEGQGQGVVLAEAKLCLDVHKSGEQKSECTEEIPAEGVKVGTTVMVWQAYIVPKGDTYDDLAIQVKHDDVIRETRDVKVDGKSWRTRTWNGVRLTKPGKWNLVIMRGEQVLKSIPVNVSAT